MDVRESRDKVATSHAFSHNEFLDYEYNYKN